MTISEAIQNIDNKKPNTYQLADKIKWLSIVDGLIYKNITSKYEHEPVLDEEGNEIEPSFEGYNINTPLTTELIVGEPYDEIYETWLAAKIDYENGDIVKYNNSITRYNDMYSEYRNDYNRDHVHLNTQIKYW